MRQFIYTILLLSAVITTFGCKTTESDPLPTTVALSGLFTEHAVLQRGKPLPVWGQAAPGQTVTIDIAGQSRTTSSDKRGKWRTSFDPITTVGPHTMTVIADKTLTVGDILIGDVWVCSGQSNMAWRVTSANNAKQEIADADNYPEIRSIYVARKISGKPEYHCKGQANL